VQEVHAAMRKRDPGFDVSESGLNDWGYKLLASGDKHGAIAIFRMVTSLHPESGNAYDSLAEAYEANQDKVRAIENYQRARQLDPKNENAERHLKALGAP
jgi:tetratricopeptide (TPR) repeat protein